MWTRSSISKALVASSGAGAVSMQSLRPFTSITPRLFDVEGVAEPEILAVNYTADSAKPKRMTFKVDQSIPARAIIQTGDVPKPAFALDNNLLPRLTPTMKRFTLEGKVAIVTG